MNSTTQHSHHHHQHARYIYVCIYICMRTCVSWYDLWKNKVGRRRQKRFKTCQGDNSMSFFCEQNESTRNHHSSCLQLQMPLSQMQSTFLASAKCTIRLMIFLFCWVRILFQGSKLNNNPTFLSCSLHQNNHIPGRKILGTAFAESFKTKAATLLIR